MFIDLLKRLYPYIRPYKGRIFGAVIFSFALAGIKFLQAFLVKPIFDRGLSQEASWEEVILLASFLLLLGAVNFPCRFFQSYWIRYVVDKAICAVRDNVFSKLQRLPTAFYSRTKQGKLVSNILNDTLVFSHGFRSAVDIIKEPLTAVFLFGLALYRDWQLTLIVIAVSPLFLWIFNRTGKKVWSNQGKVQQELSNLTHSIGEGISGHKITKAFNLQHYVASRFKAAQELFFNAQMKTTREEELAHPMVEFVGALAFSGVIVFAHHRILSGHMTTGDFVSFVTALALLMDPIRKYSQANVKLSQARAASDRIFDLLSVKEEEDFGKIELPGLKEKIEIKNLSFSYSEDDFNPHGSEQDQQIQGNSDEDILKNFSMSVYKGQKVALVGLSGSGKSTLINLLLGLHTIKRGEILIDGHSIKEVTLKSLRRLFGLVSQDVFLFHDTIRENLTLGNNYTNEQIQKALDVAYASEFVEKLPDGVETIVGDRGTRLSGGQQQRITIARAFLLNSEVLLFDEATSALDNESEQVVQKALSRLAGHKTVIAVAHRLSTIQDFDHIFVMKEGRLVEQGKHEDLMNRQGEYAKLYELSQKS